LRSVTFAFLLRLKEELRNCVFEFNAL